MNFLAPAFLAALGALAAPVLIHLLNKFRVREVRWAAMRFLQGAVKKHSRRLRFQDLLLLLLRCAALAALVLAFARPTLDPEEKTRLAVSGDQLAAMVLLDHSASMGFSDGAETRFDRARADALAWLEGLPSGSAAGLLLVHDGHAAPVGRPTRDLALVRRSVELARLTDRSTDFLPALRAAAAALRGQTGRREIHLFTDNQAVGWRDEAALRELLVADPGPRFVLHASPPADTAAPNLAVTALTLDAAVPVADQPLRLLATVTNLGASVAEGVRLTLAVNGDAPSADAFIERLAAGGSRTVPLLVRLPVGGFHTLTAQLPPDPLALDNRRDLAVQVAPAREVLVVESRTGPAPWQGSGHYVAAALVPVAPEDAGRHYLRVTRLTALELDPERLRQAALVVLCDAGPLSPESAEVLAARVRAGLGLIVFPGSAEAYAAEPWSGLLPAALGERTEPPAGLAAAPYTHPLAILWNDRAAGTLASVRFPRALALAPAPGAAVMLPFADGTPALVARPAGEGMVALAAFAPTPAASNLPLHPAFIPLLHRLVAQVVAAPAARLNLKPGEVFQGPVPLEQLNRDIFVQGPGDPTRRVAVGRTELISGQAMLRVRATAVAGVYHAFTGKEAATPDYVFAVQPDPAESELAPAREDLFSVANANTDAPGATAVVGAPSASDAAKRGPLLTARQLWFGCLLFAAVFSLLELALALRASRTA